MKKVEVYLNRKAMGKSPKRIYSIRDTKTDTVVASNSCVLLEDVELVVQPSGRRDTLSRIERGAKITKTVHAFLRGNIVYRGRNAKKVSKERGLFCAGKAVGYDPIKTDSWLELNGLKMPEIVEGLKSITRAKYAVLFEDGIYVL